MISAENIYPQIQANTDVISNITYHDVKGHRDDMEKKRSLQGGGENVKEVRIEYGIGKLH